MNTYANGRNIICGLTCIASLFIGANAYAWHGGGHYGRGYHGGSWGHHGGWGRGGVYRDGYYGRGWGNVGYIGVRGGANCKWVGAHRNRWGTIVPAQRVCWR